MPTNLPPEARAKWIKVMEAKTPEDKIRALEEFISSVPKHKGTENLLLWARRRLSQLREEVEEKKKRKGGKGPKFYIEKEGAAQLVLLGVPNSGKSSLLAKLTNAKPLVTDYPYATRAPQPGMLLYEDIQFQIIDTPSIPFDTGEKVGWMNRTIGLARNADGILIVLDMGTNPLKQLKGIITELERSGILLKKPEARVDIEKTSSGGINIVINGKLIETNVNEIKSLLKDYRIHHAIVKIWGNATLDDVEAALMENRAYKPSIILANKMDLPGSQEKLEILRKIVKDHIEIIPVSAKTGEGLEKIGETIFRQLDIVRIYTKQPNGDVATVPLILKKGSTVMDVAKSVHSRLAKHFRYAKIWGKSAKYPGERVGPDHVVEDKDVVEIFSRG